MPHCHPLAPPDLLRWRALLLGLALVIAGPAAAADPGAELFENKIRPVLVEHCYACHSAKAGKAKGGLLLDTRAGLGKGGDSGPAVRPGKPDDSPLVKALRYTDDALRMPPKGKLPDAVVADFEKWVRLGAADPRDDTAKPAATDGNWDELFRERRTHWSLQPIKPVAPPAVADPAWGANPVDRFVRTKLAGAGITPAAAADRRTLLRRVTYALTGLPPTAAEIDAFLADTTPDAYETVVDRLLASPRFGERFASHWLDVMRYAETHGSEGDPAIPSAWRYRDYVIRAFNADLPYDRFVREQIAGDLVPDPRVGPDGTNESAVGPAHLRMVEHGFQPVDSLDEQAKTVDNQIDVVTKAFLGLTAACARCHDHKFDAISQRDYYALYGVLASSRPAQVTVDDPARLRAGVPALAATKARIKAALAEAWLREADAIPAKLKAAAGREPVAKVPDERAELERKLADLDRKARDAVLMARGKESTGAGPRPFAAWRFEGDARDAVGGMHAELVGGAIIRDGRLVLDGKGAHARSAPLPRTVGEKTLEAWVLLATLDQRAGGVVSLETKTGAVFDAVVYAERQPGRWIAGSNFFRRTRDVDGPAETAKGRPVHLAAAYAADGTIRLFRNGEPYGAPYRMTGDEAGPVAFPAGDARVLIGMRHGKQGPLAGEVEEARLYDRALTADEVKASFRAGPDLIPEADLAKALDPADRAARERLRKAIDELRAKVTPETPADPWRAALADAARNPADPLHPWATLHARSGDVLAAGWRKQSEHWQAEVTARRAFNRANFTPIADLTAPTDYATWFRHGVGLPPAPVPAGEFAVEHGGGRVVLGIYPAGVYTHALSEKHNGLLTSPAFRLRKSVSVRFTGDRGGGVRVVVDQYPLGANDTYPQRRPAGGPVGWVRLDTDYRKGSDAYLEFATLDDLTRPQKPAKGGPDDGRSYVGVVRVFVHDNDLMPKEDVIPVVPVLAGTAPTTADELAGRYVESLKAALAAWRDGGLTDEQAVLLDSFVRRGLLPNTPAELPAVAPLLAEYRRLEAAVPVPRRAPGVVEAAGRDAPLFVRGNHKLPGSPVPRGFLSALGGRHYETTTSGRLDLAADLASPDNPLTRRVMVNRVWHWLFGRGLVPTPDNFGVLGEPPTHPELLDFLAARFADDGWSVKRLVRLIVTSRAYRMSSTATADGLEKDPVNALLSRSRVRRLDAEAVRDGLLAAAGELSREMYGPPTRGGPLDGGRRSVYLPVRRNDPHPFLEVFDKPAPLSTRGQRDVTTLPAQSLALLNSAFTQELAKRWAARLTADRGVSTDGRVKRVFVAALGREPTAAEAERARAFLVAAAADYKAMPDDPRPWQDFVHGVMCLKETIYLR